MFTRENWGSNSRSRSGGCAGRGCKRSVSPDLSKIECYTCGQFTDYSRNFKIFALE